MRSKIASITQMLRLPSLCVLCSQSQRHQFAVCTECMKLLIPIGPSCRYCAFPLPDDAYLVCGTCIQKKPYVDQATAAYHFEEPLRTLVHDFKYNNGLYLCNLLTALMLHAMPDTVKQTQCLIPVPMHPKRLRHRGFNQAALLAKNLAKKLQLPCDLSSCQKIINTVPQATLKAKERQKNLHNAFYIHSLPYQHITLVDDLLTTGNTVNEIAKALKNTGVLRVDVWCCARVVRK